MNLEHADKNPLIPVFDRLERVREQAGISVNNFRVMRTRGSVPEKWHGRIHMASKDTPHEILIEELVALLPNQNQLPGETT